MGFDQERSALALKQAGNLNGAMDWLEKHQDRSLDDIKAEIQNDADGAPALAVGETARSLMCNECGKKFRSQAQAEFHAGKTQHTDFAESTEEIAPLTEEEKAARLAELREKLAAKRGQMSEQDKIDKKRNEEIRRKATKDSHDIKEELQKKEQLKEAAKKKQEKQDEIDAKKRIKAKIEADKLARKEKAEREKAEREGRGHNVASGSSATGAEAALPPTQSKPASAYKETRLRLQTPNGTLQTSMAVETTLFELAQWINQQNGLTVSTFQINFPKKAFTNEDFGLTLKEAGLVPSAALQVS